MVIVELGKTNASFTMQMKHERSMKNLDFVSNCFVRKDILAYVDTLDKGDAIEKMKYLHRRTDHLENVGDTIEEHTDEHSDLVQDRTTLCTVQRDVELLAACAD